MVYSIVIGSINYTRLKLGDTFKLAHFFINLNQMEKISVDFKRIKEFLSDYLYIYSFKKIDDITQDLITKAVKPSVLVELNIIENEQKKSFLRSIDETISVRSIDFDMFEYLNKYIWPNIVKAVFDYAISGDDNEGLEILLRIPCNVIHNYYSKYVKNDMAKSTLYVKTLMEVNATSDIVTWLISNRIAYPAREDICYNDGYIEFDITIKI